MGTVLAVTDPPHVSAALGLRAVLAITSNKGGVGKTSLATNLAIYLRALREDLPVALVGLDDQRVIDRMFALRPPRPGEGNLKHGWAERSLDRVLQIGEYGVHFVPSPPEREPAQGPGRGSARAASHPGAHGVERDLRARHEERSRSAHARMPCTRRTAS